MNRILKALLIILGSVLIINGLFLTIYSNFNTGVLLTYLLGIILILLAVFNDKLKGKLFTALKAVFAVGLCIVFSFQTFLMAYGKTDTVNSSEDAVIVLGAGIRGERLTQGLKNRLDCAIKIYDKNPDILIVVSGGQGEQETITEALAMERYLISCGIPKEVIIKEEQSHSTYDNFKYSKEILDDKLGEGYSVAYVTNDYHIYRAGELAKLTGFEKTTHIHSNTKWYTIIPSTIRECLAVIKLWVFRR